MTRALATLLAALALLLTGACSDGDSPDVTGDSVTGNQDEPPQPSVSPS